MVGVPGKSKGCSTCRRRKKGCDQKRPVCGQCAAGGYVCGGYQRDRTFIQHPATKGAEKSFYIPYIRVSPSSLTQSLDQAAITRQCRGLFWNLYMPHGDCIVKDEFILKCGHPMNWTEVVNELPNEESCLESAFSALTISRVGKDSQDDRLVQESTKLYGRALKEMQLALYDTDRMHSDEVLTASMLLGLYENFEGSTLKSRSWLSHAQGAAHLIELRGPERHRNRQAHHVFLGSRVPTIYAAILQRQATYLAATAWKTIPWENQHRTYIDRLVDTTTAIPAYLEDLDTLCTGTADPKTYLQKTELMHNLAQTQRMMDVWKGCVKADALPIEKVHITGGTDDRYPFEVEMHFDNHLFMNAHAIYYCCSLVVAEAAELLFADLALYDLAGVLRDPAIWKLTSLFDARRHATSIASMIPYCIQPDMGALGGIIINFPANLALHYFRKIGDYRVTTWLTDAFHEMGIRGLTNSPHATSKHERRISEIETRLRGAKRPSPGARSDSSEESSEGGSSPTSTAAKRTAVVVRFVHEDPARYYADSGGESS
ncbi:uncharacterized protein HMPREF1541_10300 [Cyphellophora europaea CBS 101466]|uniref:Zn(2)-C6 fungal-type domain-containing protein n=1 Tax=Cyphellophora europaea (strain CBS 101466) TaxID=1220924 RepID=W2S7L8_CYPE1|nr:uncharacterized protein HMPREF1541_10300 [Cyphellophora europaea CBS 101466]ETN44630.1 hypothetical protein HMPREF1541_10300 [Cyphellophora europaea CBS 101466]